MDFYDPIIDLCSSSLQSVHRTSITNTCFESWETHFSHSSSSTYITSYSSYFGPDRSSPHQTWRRKNGFAQKSGFVGSSFSGGNRRTSLKSIEFSDGGFHFRLDAYKFGNVYATKRSHIHVWVGSRSILGTDTCIYQTIRAVLKCWYIY